MKPKTIIIIGNEKIKTKLMEESLSKSKKFQYNLPNVPHPVSVVFGFSAKAR